MSATLYTGDEPEHRGARSSEGPLPGRLDGLLRLRALDYVDTAGVDYIGGDGEVEAAGPSGPVSRRSGSRKVGLALARV